MIDDVLLNQRLGPVGPVGPGAGQAKRPTPTTGPSFTEVFNEKLQAAPLKLSAHAQQRLSSRQIDLTPQDWEKIQNGVDQAAAKGAREALVLTDKAALVVSVRNRTVITAVDPANMKANVFTNIDSAVIV
jgi:flagellar operon protein